MYLTVKIFSLLFAKRFSWEPLGLQGDPTSPSERRSVLGVHWKNWCWSWNSNTLATSCRVDSFEKTLMLGGLGSGGEGDDRGWDGWMASPTWVWVNSRSWWWTGRPDVLQFMGSQRVGDDWATELNWAELLCLWIFPHLFPALCCSWPPTYFWALLLLRLKYLLSCMPSAFTILLPN